MGGVDFTGIYMLCSFKVIQVVSTKESIRPYRCFPISATRDSGGAKTCMAITYIPI